MAILLFSSERLLFPATEAKVNLAESSLQTATTYISELGDDLIRFNTIMADLDAISSSRLTYVSIGNLI